jgi:hypothetical protein
MRHLLMLLALLGVFTIGCAPKEAAPTTGTESATEDSGSATSEGSDTTGGEEMTEDITISEETP